MKITMLVDEVLANVIENGQDIGPKRVFVGDTVEVWDGVGDLLVTQNRAVKVKETPPKVEVKSKKNDNRDTGRSRISKKGNKK